MRFFLLFSLLLLFTSCNKNRLPVRTPTVSSASSESSQVVQTAKSYLGTKYKYGGNSRKGMDCSGLLWLSYQTVGVNLPRSSHQQAKAGSKISLREVSRGDALFFAQPGGAVSHSGIVESVRKNGVFFIHSSSSKGVMISSLEQLYWKKRFVKAVRFIP